MILTRSKDKKIISVTNFDKESMSGDYFYTLAWTAKLKPFTTSDNFQNLNESMSRYYHRYKSSFVELVEVSFVGSSKYV